MSPKNARRHRRSHGAHRSARGGLARHRHAAEVRGVDAGRLHPSRGPSPPWRATTSRPRWWTARRVSAIPPRVLAMELAITKAATYGIGIVAVRNSNHFGACANYSMMALARGMIGFAVTNSPFVAMVPTFAKKPMMGTNPLSLAAPAARPRAVRARHGDDHRRGGQAHHRLALEQADPGGLGPRRAGPAHLRRARESSPRACSPRSAAAGSWAATRATAWA